MQDNGQGTYMYIEKVQDIFFLFLILIINHHNNIQVIPWASWLGHPMGQGI